MESQIRETNNDQLLNNQLFLTMIIHTAETLSYSLRYAGVKINKIAVALSLTGIMVLVSRTANLIQAPLTAKFIDFARTDPSFNVLYNLRIILIAASVGTFIAIVLFPTFVNIWASDLEAGACGFAAAAHFQCYGSSAAEYKALYR